MSREPECLQCRLVGGGALVGTGTYALYSSRPKALGSPVGKRFVGLMGGGMSIDDACLSVLKPILVFIVAGIVRLWPLIRYPQLDQQRQDLLPPQGLSTTQER